MTEQEIDRARIEAVFRLEIDGSWTYETDDGGTATMACTYEGRPDQPLWDTDYATVIASELWGPIPTPKGWERVDTFTSSGETECYCEGKDGECPLCEGDGFIYIGEGWREIVFRKTAAQDYDPQ